MNHLTTESDDDDEEEEEEEEKVASKSGNSMRIELGMWENLLKAKSSIGKDVWDRLS